MEAVFQRKILNLPFLWGGEGSGLGTGGVVSNTRGQQKYQVSSDENSTQALSRLPENNDLSISLAPVVAFIASFFPSWGFLFSETWMLRRHHAELRQLIHQKIAGK